MAKRSLKEMLRLDLDDLLRMNMKELQSIYRDLGKVTEKRVATFEKHGAGSAQAIRKVRIQPKSPRRFRKRELAREIFNKQLFLSGDESSYSKYKKEQKKLREELERKTGLRIRTMKQFEKYKKFMNEIKDRFSSLPDWYAAAKRVYASLQRIGVDASRKTFTSNFEYWLEQTEKLEKVPDAQIAKMKKNGKVSVKALMQDLGLPPIPEDSDE